jgi:hypothetical protein
MGCFWAAVILLTAVLSMIWLVVTITQFINARSFGPELTSLCTGYEPATALSDTVPDGKLVVLQGRGKRIHPWHNKLPDDRRADSPGEVDHVVCILRPSSYAVETCKYSMGGRAKRIRRGYEVLFVDPQRGTPVFWDEVYGPYPDRCPESKGASFLTETIKGEKPGFQEFASFLEGQPSIAQPPVTRTKPTAPEQKP